ncbi:MAG: 5-nucleotide phosphatase [Alphaproteobacteria bacterium]|nr:MAG: 5-nucleotide phosphatase [Alphaproteobacteria bacterium]
MTIARALALGAITIMLGAGTTRAQDPQPSDLLLGTLWNQRSVEYKGNALTVYALAKIRLDQALADKSWTAAPGEQKGDYQSLPPAVVLDVDETLLDNSLYQVWMLKNNQTFSTKTWNEFCAAQVSRAIPGAVEFTKLADSKGVKVFYVSNRGAETEKDTRANMEKLGFPMGGNVDTFLMQNEKPDWGSAKSTRRAAIAKDYRILLNFGDNFGDFDDRYRLNEAERQKAFEENRERWGREWLVIANPTYGSFDTAPYGSDQGQVGRAGELGRAEVTKSTSLGATSLRSPLRSRHRTGAGARA